MGREGPCRSSWRFACATIPANTGAVGRPVGNAAGAQGARPHDGPAERTITVLTSDELESDFALGSADVIYTVYLMLYEPFSDDWETSMNAFTTSRDAIIATLQDYDTTDGIIESFRADTPVGGVYYDESLDGTGVPVYIAQRLAVTIREYDE